MNVMPLLASSTASTAVWLTCVPLALISSVRALTCSMAFEISLMLLLLCTASDATSVIVCAMLSETCICD